MESKTDTEIKKWGRETDIKRVGKENDLDKCTLCKKKVQQPYLRTLHINPNEIFIRSRCKMSVACGENFGTFTRLTRTVDPHPT